MMQQSIVKLDLPFLCEKLALKQLNEKFVCCNISHSSNSSMNNKIPGSNMFSYNLGLKELILSSTWEMHRYLQLVNF